MSMIRATLLALLFASSGTLNARAQNSFEPLFQQTVTILPDTYFTLISPSSGDLDKVPAVGEVYTPGSNASVSGYIESGDTNGLSALEEEYKVKSIAHIQADLSTPARHNINVDNDRKIFHAFHLPYAENNRPPWSFIARTNGGLSALERVVYDVIRGSLSPIAMPPPPKSIPSSLSAAQSDPLFANLIAETLKRSPPSSENDVLEAFREVLAWLRKPPGWLVKFGISPAPYGAPIWAPNQIDLLDSNGRSTLNLVLPRAQGYGDLFAQSALGRLCAYWTWVKAESFLDENDRLFLLTLAFRAKVNVADRANLFPVVDALLSECSEAQMVQYSNIVLAASIFDAMVNGKTSDFIAEPNSRILLAAAIQRVKSGASKINIGTLPYLKQLGPPPQGLDKVAISQDMINAAALAMTFAAYREAQQKITWESALWLTEQLRPSSPYAGKLLGVEEEVGHVTRHGSDDFDKLKDQYGRPFRPEDLPPDPLYYHVSTPTQTLPLGYRENSSAGALMAYRSDVSDYLSFAITDGKGVNSLYDTFSAIESRTAASISSSVLSANVSQSPDQMFAVDQTSELSLLAMEAELASAGEQKRAELTRANDDYDDSLDRDRLGNLFVADDAIVVATLHGIGRISSGDAIAIVRPVFSNEVVIAVTASEEQEFSLVPGNTLSAKVDCPGIFPLSQMALGKLLQNPKHDQLAHGVEAPYQKYLSTRSFQATVTKVDRSGFGQSIDVTVHFRLSLEKGQRSVSRDILGSADAGLEGGFLIADASDVNLLRPSGGALEPGRRCNIRFGSESDLLVDRTGRLWWKSINR